MSDYEDLIEAAVGKTGFSQWFICLVCRGMIMIVAWAMIMMSFAGAEPTWWTETIVKNVTGKREIYDPFRLSLSFYKHFSNMERTLRI